MEDNTFEYKTTTDSETTFDIPTVEEKLEIAEKNAKDWENKYLYKVAEFENYRKRTIKEKSDLNQYKDESFGKDILDVIDNFERSLNAFVIHDDVNKANKEGIEIIYNQLINTLKNHDITKIEIQEGDDFNENIMNAIATLSIPNFEDNDVINIAKSGWKLKDKVIRFADVVVNKIEI